MREQSECTHTQTSWSKKKHTTLFYTKSLFTALAKKQQQQVNIQSGRQPTIYPSNQQHYSGNDSGEDAANAHCMHPCMLFAEKRYQWTVLNVGHMRRRRTRGREGRRQATGKNNVFPHKHLKHMQYYNCIYVYTGISSKSAWRCIHTYIHICVWVWLWLCAYILLNALSHKVCKRKSKQFNFITHIQAHTYTHICFSFLFIHSYLQILRA